MAALWRDGRTRRTGWAGGLIVVLTVVLAVGLVAAAASAGSALADDDRAPRSGSLTADVATPSTPAMPALSHAKIASAFDLTGVLRETKVVIAGVEANGAIVTAGLLIADAPVRAIAARGLLSIAAGVGPVVGRHRSGHLRT